MKCLLNFCRTGQLSYDKTVTVSHFVILLCCLCQYTEWPKWIDFHTSNSSHVLSLQTVFQLPTYGYKYLCVVSNERLFTNRFLHIYFCCCFSIRWHAIGKQMRIVYITNQLRFCINIRWMFSYIFIHCQWGVIFAKKKTKQKRKRNVVTV